MSQTNTSPEGTPLKQVLVKSVTLKRDLDLKQGWFWERGGFGPVATALKDEYTKLLVQHDKLQPKIAGAPEELQKRFHDLETEMKALEDEHITNDDTLRNAHKTKVSAQIKVAELLDADVEAAAKLRKQQEDAAKAVKTLADDQALMRDLVTRSGAWSAMDVGGKVIADAKKMLGAVSSYRKPVLEENRPLTGNQREQLKGFDAIDKAYKDAADEEQKRKDAAKALADWADALDKAVADAKAWRDDVVIAEGVTIFGGGSKEARGKIALDKLVEGLSAFDRATPDHAKLNQAVKAIDDAGLSLKGVLGPVVAGRDAFVAKAVDAIEAKVDAPGEEPYKSDVKKAADPYSGLVDEILAAYRVKHFDSEPQRKRRQQQAASKKGEADKFKRVGGWMDECGLGGTPRSGPNGPVFMSALSAKIDGFKTHFSQYQANAKVPPNGLDSKLKPAMDALFAGAGPTCPHLTQERVEQHGSPDNARLFASGLFLPGNVPANERAALKTKMEAELKRMLGIFETRMKDLLKSP